jgi:hypothetical protein
MSVDARGGLFTREFIIEFSCEKGDLEKWVSPNNLDKSTPMKEENGIRVYQVPGKNGSIGGYVYIDGNRYTVIVDMKWS